MLGHSTELCYYILSTSHSPAILNLQEVNMQITVFTCQILAPNTLGAVQTTLKES